MGEDPNGRLPGDADEPREPFPRPLSIRLREAAHGVAMFLDMAEGGEFPAQDKANRDMFQASLTWLEGCVEAARRTYVAQMRGYHRHRARAMEVDDRLATIDDSEAKRLPL